jgi:hypothetical protein
MPVTPVEVLGYAMMIFGLLYMVFPFTRKRVKHWAVQFDGDVNGPETVKTYWLRVSGYEQPFGTDVRTVVGPFRDQAECDEFIVKAIEAEDER